jgi:hypothetical protein
MEKTYSTVNRRNFIKLTGINGAGFIGLSLKSNTRIAEITKLSDDGSLYDLTPNIMIAI